MILNGKIQGDKNIDCPQWYRHGLSAKYNRPKALPVLIEIQSNDRFSVALKQLR